ncbi:MAG: DUF1176 domain-containing protein [Pseudanabaena sp. ELA607]
MGSQQFSFLTRLVKKLVPHQVEHQMNRSRISSHSPHLLPDFRAVLGEFPRMTQIVSNPLIALIGAGLLVGCSNNAPVASPTPTQSKATDAAPSPTTKTSETPQPSAKATPSKTTDGPRIGNVSEMEGDVTCRQTGGIYAYAETSSFKVYVCSDVNNPNQPRYYRSFNQDGSPGLNLTADKYNPLKADRLEFRNDAYTYSIDLFGDSGDKPMLRVGTPDGKTSTEPLTVLLNRASTKAAPPKTASSNQPTSSAAVRHVLDHEAELGICDPNGEKSPTKRQTTTYPVGDGKVVVRVLCFTAAYQAAYGLAVYSEPQGKPTATALSFDSFDMEKDPQQPTRTKSKGLVGLLNFDANSKQLTVMTKYRGVGDCGQVATYKWDGDKFTLKQFQAKAACDGKYQKPTDYPQIFP